jgi:outer membrane lipoprotein
MKMTVKCTWLSLLAAVAASSLSSCASIPTQLQGEYAEISPALVQPHLLGSKVRWGGVLVDTRNETDRTCFEVLSRALDRTMRPLAEDNSKGRFIACTDGFYDPEVYAKGRSVTITGKIENLEERKIEAFDYRYPVVAITDLVLWEERENVIVNQYYDPFYYPFFWGHPYWGIYYPYYRHPWPYAGPRNAGPREAPRSDSTTNKRDR